MKLGVIKVVVKKNTTSYIALLRPSTTDLYLVDAERFLDQTIEIETLKVPTTLVSLQVLFWKLILVWQF
jgi:hypothetical protein